MPVIGVTRDVLNNKVNVCGTGLRSKQKETEIQTVS
jgi:hypothetical protein